MNKKELGDAFKAKADELDTIVNNPELTAEDVEKAKGIKAEMAGLKEKLDIAVAAEGLRTDLDAAKSFLGQSATPVVHGDPNFIGATAAGETVISDAGVTEEGQGLMSAKQWKAVSQTAYKSAWMDYVRRRGDVGLMDTEARKALNEGTDEAGGYFVPPEFLNQLITKLATPTRVSGMVRNVNTSRDALVMPKVVYATDDLYQTGIRSTWVGETPSSSTVHRVGTEPVFGQIRIPVYTNMLSMPITRDLLDDSAFDIMGYASDQFRLTIQLLKDNMVINGSGIGQPDGILLNPNGTDQPATVVSGSAAALTADGLKDLQYAIPEQYDGNCSFLFNKKSTEKAIAKIKDGAQRYMFDNMNGGIANGVPNTLLGDSYARSGFMPDIAANAYPIIYGDFSGYALVNRIGFSIQMLNELYAETNQILMLGRVRFGGKTIEPWKLKIQKCST
jgi:HK97 family phage major capsid protein